MFRLRFLQVISLTLIIIGVVGLVPFVALWSQHQTALKQAAAAPAIPSVAPPPKPQAITGKPVRITISSPHIDLPVVDGVYDAKTGEWTLSLNKAHYALPSTQPNDQSGNTLIYGHYRPEVFAYLHLIKPGATATLTTDNGYTFNYTFMSSEPLDPTDTSIFTYQGPPRLTIQTCSGSYMQHRQMYYFRFDSVTKN